MKKLLMVCAVSLTTILGGCATTNPDGTTTQPDIAALIAQVQSYTQTACGFVPTATTIANIISVGNPAILVATSIAQAICTAVTPMHAGRKAFVAKSVKGWSVTPGAVNGVTVEGTRTR